MKKLAFFLLLLMPLTFVMCQNPAEPEKVTDPVLEVLELEAFKTKMQTEGIQLVDVRTPKEFGEGHIKGAANIDYFASDFRTQVGKQLDPGKPLLVYCKSGKRSARATKIMQELGFKEIYDLQGGFLAWDAAQKKD